jgi:prevent-host-death family protein
MRDLECAIWNARSGVRDLERAMRNARRAPYGGGSGPATADVYPCVRILLRSRRVERVGIRELRTNVAAVVRRAGAGERIVVTVDGKPVAQLGPLDAPAAATLDDLVAAGLAVPPGRPDRPEPPGAEDAPVDMRADGVLDELRGR